MNHNLKNTPEHSYAVVILPICQNCKERTYTKYNEFLDENVSYCCNSEISSEDDE